MRLALRVAGAALSAALCGCTSSPPAPNDTVHEPKIMRGVLSELYCAVKFLRQRDPLNPQFPLDPSSPNSEVYRANFIPADEYWIAEIDLQLKTDAEASANPSFTLIGPVNSGVGLLPGRTPGSYNAAIGGEFDQTSTLQREEKMYVDINLLMQHWAPPNQEAFRKNPYQFVLADPVDCQHPTDGTYLEGTLGIKPWLQRAMQAYQFGRYIEPTTAAAVGAPLLKSMITDVYPASTSPASAPIPIVTPDLSHPNPTKPPMGSTATFGATFTFLLKGNVQVGPSVTFDHAKAGGPTLFSVMRTETNDVLVSLTPSAYENITVVGTKTVFGSNTGGRRAALRRSVVVSTQPSRVQSVSDAISRLDATILNMQLNTLSRN
jgi:hypothetical protein